MTLTILGIGVVAFALLSIICCMVVSEKEADRKKREEEITRILNDIMKGGGKE